MSKRNGIIFLVLDTCGIYYYIYIVCIFVELHEFQVRNDYFGSLHYLTLRNVPVFTLSEFNPTFINFPKNVVDSG